MANIVHYTIASTLLFVCAVCLILFAIQYPALNNQTTILVNNPTFNNTANNLTALLGQYQTTTNSQISSSTNDTPTTSGLTVQLISTVSVARLQMSEITGSFALIVDLISNSLGLSAGNFLLIVGSIIALFSFVLLYITIKFIRWGTD